MTSIISQIQTIVGTAPTEWGPACITYITACVLLILIACFVFRFLMSILGRH